MLMAALELLQRESWEGNLQITKKLVRGGAQCWALFCSLLPVSLVSVTLRRSSWLIAFLTSSLLAISSFFLKFQRGSSHYPLLAEFLLQSPGENLVPHLPRRLTISKDSAANWILEVALLFFVEIKDFHVPILHHVTWKEWACNRYQCFMSDTSICPN